MKKTKNYHAQAYNKIISKRTESGLCNITEGNLAINDVFHHILLLNQHNKVQSLTMVIVERTALRKYPFRHHNKSRAQFILLEQTGMDDNLTLGTKKHLFMSTRTHRSLQFLHVLHNQIVTKEFSDADKTELLALFVSDKLGIVLFLEIGKRGTSDVIAESPLQNFTALISVSTPDDECALDPGAALILKVLPGAEGVLNTTGHVMVVVDSKVFHCKQRLRMA